MRQLFIPEIGTEIILAQPWNIGIHGERRNQKLLEKLGYTSFPSFYKDETGEEGWIDLCLTESQDEEFTKIMDSCYTGKKVKSQFHRDEYEDEFDRDLWDKKRIEFYQKYKDIAPRAVPYTFETGIVLKVDRIYIRKGNKEYSSVTFYAKSGKLKGQRFWVKLNEVNQMIIE